MSKNYMEEYQTLLKATDLNEFDISEDDIKKYDSDDDNNYIVNVQVCVIHVILYNNFIMIS